MQVLMVGSAGALPAAVGADGEAPGDEADEVAVAARRQPKKKRRGIVGALAVRPAQDVLTIDHEAGRCCKCGLCSLLSRSPVLRVVHQADGAETGACAVRLHARHARGQKLLADGDIVGGWLPPMSQLP